MDAPRHLNAPMWWMYTLLPIKRSECSVEFPGQTADGNHQWYTPAYTATRHGGLIHDSTTHLVTALLCVSDNGMGEWKLLLKPFSFICLTNQT